MPISQILLTTTQTTPLIFELDAAAHYDVSGEPPTWHDTSGKGHHVLLANNPSFMATPPEYCIFDPDALNYGYGTTLNSLSNWTVEAWFRPHADLSTQGLTAIVTTVYDDGVNYGAINFCLTNYDVNTYGSVNGIGVGFFGNSSWHMTDKLTTTPNTWYHVVGTYNGSDLKQYNNGTLAATHNANVSSFSGGGPIRIARRWDAPEEAQYCFPGDIALIRVYNSALSAAAVEERWNATRTTYGL